MRTFCAFPCRGVRLKWFGILLILTFSVILTGAPQWGAFAQDHQQAQQAQAAQQAPAQQAQPTTQSPITLVPVSLEGPVQRAEKAGTAVHMSLRDVIKLALQNNLSIAIADTNEDIKQQALIGTYGAFDPTFGASLSTSSSNRANTQVTTQSSSGFINTSKSSYWNTNVSQPLPWYGGSLTLSWNTTRTDSNQTNDLFSPQYQTSGLLSFTQPLLRNLRVDSNRMAIKVANLNLKLNDSAFRTTLTSTIASIESAYWNLVSAVAAYDISVSSVQLAREQVAMNQKKVDVGTMAIIDVITSQASQAQREVTVIKAEDTLLQAENRLKNYISKDRTADIWGQTIVPTEKTDFVEYKIDLNTSLMTALKNSPTLETDDLNLQNTDFTYKLYQNSRKWQVNLVASLGSGGVAGPQAYRTDAFGNVTPVNNPANIGGLFTSYSTLFSQDTYNWNVGFSISIPLRNRNVNSQLASTRITREQQVMTRVQDEQTVIVNIRNYVQALETAKKQIETAHVGTQAAQAQLDAEQKRLEAGLSQNFQVMQDQDALTTAQNAELNALISYKTAVINLQSAMYTILDENNINTKGVTKTPATFK
jgi:outer membrane protein TolC